MEEVAIPSVLCYETTMEYINFSLLMNRVVIAIVLLYEIIM